MTATAAEPSVARGLAGALNRRRRRIERLGYRRLARFGNRVRCPVCSWSGLRLAPSHKPRRTNRICPECLSSERYRALELYLRRNGRAEPGSRLLEVAPIHTVARTAREMGYDYASVDLRNQRAMVHGDLCRLPFASGSFDVVVCFHVLEHIPADRDAVRELARVVGTTGEAIVVVPRDDDRADTFEDPDADPADYERLFGQSDHVRIYGRDILERWDLEGVSVTEQLWSERFTPDVHRYAALTGDDDRFWIIRATE
jgi:SAM-dependent methyltransferase